MVIRWEIGWMESVFGAVFGGNFLRGNGGETCFGITSSVSVLKKNTFWAKRVCLKRKRANYPCQRFDFSRKQSHVSFILCCVRFAPFPYILRCIVTKELHHLNVEQICVGLVISQIMSANVSTTKAPPYPKSCYSRQHPPNPAFCHSGLGFLLIVNLTPKDCI